MHPEYKDAFDRFTKNTEHHEMTIIRAEGVNRHLRFRCAESSSYWFDIITWPGVLCINGDMGTYVFARLNDMFEFFSVESERHPINPGYWAEKLLAVDKNCVITEFDEFEFARILREVMHDWLDEEDIWTVEFDIIDRVDYSTPREEAFALAAGFELDGEYPFADIWEYRCEKYTIHYLWCCFAITYAIRKFREYELENN